MSAELDALTAEAAAVDAVNAPPVEPVPDAVPVEPVQTGNEQAEVAGLLTIVSGLFAPMFPCLAKIYTPETVQSLAAAAVPVVAKRGWTTGALLGKYAEELALAAVALPVAFATWQGIGADLAASKAQEKSEPAKAITAANDEPLPVNPDPANFIQRG